jgi:hypothetical protein
VRDPRLSRLPEEELRTPYVGLAHLAAARGAVDYGVQAAYRLLDTFPGKQVTFYCAEAPAAAPQADLASLQTQTLDYP